MKPRKRNQRRTITHNRNDGKKRNMTERKTKRTKNETTEISMHRNGTLTINAQPKNQQAILKKKQFAKVCRLEH